nr:zinc finger protein AEBP2-like isoform X2 [Paramormyrops kingsleyae]
MAACTIDKPEPGSAPSSNQRGAWICDKSERTGGLEAPKRQPGGDSEAIQRDRAEEESVKLLAVPDSSGAGDGDGDGERTDRDPERPRQSRNAGISAICTGDGAEKEEQRKEEEEEECSLGGGDAAEKRSVTGSRHDNTAAGAEVSSSPPSSGGDPPTRRGSEDSTLMEVESTVSSGRSTPAMLTGILGGPGPAANPASSTKGPAYPCCWDRCLESFCSSPDLAEHIRGMHADSQRGGMYVCLWKGCKVYNTPSSSPSWLQRHLLSHSGDKPFKCVVAGCNASFASQGGVARHVPSHFSQQNSSKLSGQPRAKEESPSKAGVRRRRLRARHHRSLRTSPR